LAVATGAGTGAPGVTGTDCAAGPGDEPAGWSPGSKSRTSGAWPAPDRLAGTLAARPTGMVVDVESESGASVAWYGCPPLYWPLYWPFPSAGVGSAVAGPVLAVVGGVVVVVGGGAVVAVGRVVAVVDGGVVLAVVAVVVAVVALVAVES